MLVHIHSAYAKVGLSGAGGDSRIVEPAWKEFVKQHPDVVEYVQRKNEVVSYYHIIDISFKFYFEHVRFIF